MRTRAPRVVGRREEFRVLKNALADARAGRGSALFLVGEPGIGKSRLTDETVELAFSAGMQVLRGRGSDVGHVVPFRPLAQALLSLVRAGEQPPITELGAYRPVLGQLVPEWSDGEQVGGHESLVVLGEALLRLTALIGRESGCLFALDDLHNADAETLSVLDYIVDNLADQPTVLLMTCRDEPCGLLDLAESAEHHQWSTIHHLDRLAPAAVRELAGVCLNISSAEVPDPASELLWASSAGNPFVVEEMLHEMVTSGTLVRTTAGWMVVDERRPEVPVTLVRNIGQRADRLGVQARRMLSAAAVLGRRFNLPVVQQMTGMDDLNLFGHLRAAVAVQLIGPDEPAPDWYSFQHPLTAEALLAALTPSEQAEISGRAADAIEAIYPTLRGEWCQLAASLRLDSADQTGAARLYAEAGRRALADGAATSAVSLLERAEQLLFDDPSAVDWAKVVHTLIYALTEAGQFDRAINLVGRLDELPGRNLGAAERAALHIRLARTFDTVGRWEEGAAQLTTARVLLGPHPDDTLAAELDAVAADLAMESPARDQVQAEQLARRALAVAQRVPLPAIACHAWLTIGTIARGRDLAEARDCFDRARALADEHQLPNWRLHALFLMAGNDWLADGDTTGCDMVSREAARTGSVTTGCLVDSTLAMHFILTGEYPAAAALLAESLALTTRLRMDAVRRYLLLATATLAAHRGDRRTMERVLTDFRLAGGERSREHPLSLGLARAFCALLEENQQLAWHELDDLVAVEDSKPTPFSLAGRHGLRLLLAVLRGEAGLAEAKEIGEHVAGTMRWNRQFCLLANAVLLGRDGNTDEAMTAFAAAQEAAEIYPVARHLGLRLVADAAVTDGWGDPLSWLRTSEAFFHQQGVPAIASACRAQLRLAGASVQQRRKGFDRIPPRLRMIGLTSREFEVFELLPQRLGNKALGDRLHISARTVEKHIASLMVKTGMTDRETLYAYAVAAFRDG